MVREDDRKKFVVLAEKRVTRALKDIRLIGNLSNRSNYKYAEEDARKICKALDVSPNSFTSLGMTSLGR